MARPQRTFTAKPATGRNSRSDKMRMSHDRMRRDIKRIKAEQTEATAMETSKPGRK
jgi:hypothetical protein